MNNKDPKENGYSTRVIFESIMSLVYVFCAYVLLATDYFTYTLNEKFRIPLGIILAVYGLFRVFRAIRKLKSAKNDEK